MESIVSNQEQDVISMLYKNYDTFTWQLNNGWEMTMDREAVSKVIFPNDQFRLGK